MKKNKLEIKKELHFPHSLGLLYTAFTYYTGFKVNSGEYKLTTFMLDQKYFNYSTGLYENENFNNLFKNIKKMTQIKLISFIWIGLFGVSDLLYNINLGYCC